MHLLLFCLFFGNFVIFYNFSLHFDAVRTFFCPHGILFFAFEFWSESYLDIKI